MLGAAAALAGIANVNEPKPEWPLPRRVNEYLELPARVELLNSRFSVLQEMLDMVRNHQVCALT